MHYLFIYLGGFFYTPLNIHSFYRAYDEYMSCVVEKHLISDLFTLKTL